MAVCRVCGAELLHVITREGRRLAVDAIPEAKGPDRYAVDEWREAFPVDPDRGVYAHRDHLASSPSCAPR